MELGIRYFDVAPSYGAGTAEEVLGAVLGDSREITIATKVGVPRPVYSERSNLLKRTVKPVLNRVRALKTAARWLYFRSHPISAERPRFDFSAAAIRASLETSLKNLRRSNVDVFLAHEPHRDDLREDIAAGFQALLDQGMISAFGVGIDAREEPWSSFGSVWQSGWPKSPPSQPTLGVARIFHGVVRFAPKDRLGATIEPANLLLRRALSSAPSCIILVSASTPTRLRELLRDVDQPLET